MSIKVFIKNSLKHIVFQVQITASEIEGFESAFKENIHYDVSFINLKSIPKSIVERLYQERYIKQQTLTLYVQHPRLSKYLTSLGLQNVDISQAGLEQHKKIKAKPLKSITIGGSADSLEKIVAMVESIPLADISIFVIQHIKEDAQPLFDKILQNKTQYRVAYPKDQEEILEGHLYISPPARHMRVAQGKIYLDNSPKVNYARPSLSVLFESIAHYYGSQNITVLTCGYGHDGSDALKTLRQAGSGVIISAPDECGAQDMVNNAIATHEYHHILTTDEIRSLFNTLLQTLVDKDSFITRFLKEIKSLYGYDFIKYDRNSVTRRIEALMLKLGINSLPLLAKEVLIHKPLFDELLLSISINVTEFFRKPSLYVAMRDLLADEFQETHLKIWVAGSSTGEEPYSIAMILDELGLYSHSLIYATDFNPIVINEAKSGLYSQDALNSSIKNANVALNHSTFEDYVEKHISYFAIKEYLQKNVLFFTHNLVTDRSFNQFDLISCKNVLIYFTLNLQELVFDLFYESLCEGGYLQLGESESLPPSFSKKFRAYSVEHKIYQKVS